MQILPTLSLELIFTYVYCFYLFRCKYCCKRCYF